MRRAQDGISVAVMSYRTFAVYTLQQFATKRWLEIVQNVPGLVIENYVNSPAGEPAGLLT